MRMAEIQLDTVLKFLRTNGLSHCESALMEDVRDKSHLQFDNFCFPLLSPPPPLRTFQDDKSSSDDEFLSLGSPISGLSSSEFITPFGVRTSRQNSQTSSDRMSQFGTARYYPDFDMQNDHFWYKENDDDYDMPSLSGAQDFDGYPSEDKYITTVQTEEKIHGSSFSTSLPHRSSKHLASQLSLTSMHNLKGEAYKDYLELGEIGVGAEKWDEHCTDYSCLDPLCICCTDAQMAYASNLKLVEANIIHLSPSGDELAGSDTTFSTKRNSTRDCFGGLNDNCGFHNHGKDSRPNKEDNCELIYDDATAEEYHEPEAIENQDSGSVSNELQIYETMEDDYEVFHLKIIHRKNRTGFEENKEFPIVINSIIAGRYCIMEFLGSAAFSRVIQAHDLHTGRDVCLKIIKNDKEFFDQSLDEVKLLKFVNKHDPADVWHILRLYDYFYYQEHLFIVAELLRANLYEFQKYNRESGGEPYFTVNRLQVIARQCLEALLYLHDLGIIHCDLKPENILIKSYRRCEIKVIDLGSSCFQTDHLSMYVQSRSYRAPEVILGLPYDHKIDLWSLGCILAELYSGEVLFPNETVVIILARMISILGPIDKDMLQKGEETRNYFTEDYDLYYINEDSNEIEYIVPKTSSLEHQLGVSDPAFLDFLKHLLQINPERRPTAREALKHPWLTCSYKANSF